MKWRGKEWQREHMAEVAQGMARGAMGGISIELLVKCWHAGGITCCVCGGRAGSAVQAAQRRPAQGPIASSAAHRRRQAGRQRSVQRSTPSRGRINTKQLMPA